MNQKSKKPWHLVMLLAVDLALLILISSFCTAKTQAARLGSSGERVAEIQHRLSEIGFYSGEINGEYNFKTRRGIKQIQSCHGINPSGETDYETLYALEICCRLSDCFSLQTELLARCIQQSECRSYPDMLQTGINILSETNGIMTLGRYISLNFPDFNKADEPTSEAYSAALQAIRLSS